MGPIATEEHRTWRRGAKKAAAILRINARRRGEPSSQCPAQRPTRWTTTKTCSRATIPNQMAKTTTSCLGYVQVCKLIVAGKSAGLLSDVPAS